MTLLPITANQLLRELTGHRDLPDQLQEVLAWKAAHALVSRLRRTSEESKQSQAREECEALILRGIEHGSLTPVMLDWAQGLSLHDLRAFIDCTTFRDMCVGTEGRLR